MLTRRGLLGRLLGAAAAVGLAPVAQRVAEAAPAINAEALGTLTPAMGQFNARYSTLHSSAFVTGETGYFLDSAGSVDWSGGSVRFAPMTQQYLQPAVTWEEPSRTLTIRQSAVQAIKFMDEAEPIDTFELALTAVPADELG